MSIYGYCRISTARQNIDRQERNILAAYPTAEISKEIYTGTKYQGRKQLEKIISRAKPGDTIVFDEVSRMSRNAAEGISLYMDLFDKGINLVFLKEPHINTETYTAAMGDKLVLTGDDVDDILIGINNYLKKLATRQIELAFKSAQAEIDYLHQRTKEGLQTAKLKGKQVGQKPGATWETKKSIEAKKKILRHSKKFGGSLSDTELIRMIGISRNSFYKYKAELSAKEN